MKIGILGGSFNPVHIGHLILARTVLEEIRLDKIIFIPCYIQPLKSSREFAFPEHRLEMLRLALEGNDSFEISDIEIKRKGKSYTVDTLKILKKTYDDLFFIIGIDNLREFHKWKEPDKILRLAKLIVTNRGGIDQKIPKRIRRKEIITCKIPNIEISSSYIRERIREGKSIKFLVPDNVEKYILINNLYKNDGG